MFPSVSGVLDDMQVIYFRESNASFYLSSASLLLLESIIFQAKLPSSYAPREKALSLLSSQPVSHWWEVATARILTQAEVQGFQLQG